MLSYWCEIAELDLNYVIDRARSRVGRRRQRWGLLSFGLQRQGLVQAEPDYRVRRDA